MLTTQNYQRISSNKFCEITEKTERELFMPTFTTQKIHTYFLSDHKNLPHIKIVFLYNKKN